MPIRNAGLMFLSFVFLSCTESSAQLSIELAFPNLTFEQPVDIQNAADGSDRLFILSQPGVITVFQNEKEVSETKTFLDISSKVVDGGERGLLGLAFHPEYKTNGYFYLDYTTGNPLTTRISRFQVSNTDPDKANPNSELVLLQVSQPYSNHNGGQIAFGPDGYLYISFGDGGGAGDTGNNAQNLGSLLGKILRIDVNSISAGKNYSIPPDNPFAGNTEGFREEIYAFGLRNVWRFSFDNSGKLWAADVGQDLWEEVDIIKKGKNYGWHVMEGLHCYNPSTGCDPIGLELPIHEYYHNEAGGYSITGGYVYGGSDASELNVKYIFADFGSGNIWHLAYETDHYKSTLISATDYAISTFGIDEKNELYFADYFAGKIYKFKGETSSNRGDLQPGKFKLYQNYPNPFNPSTVLKFSNDELQFITLKVYDSLGRVIETLVEEYKYPGEYEIAFDGSKLASGIYFYRLQNNLAAESKKMLLLQ